MVNGRPICCTSTSRFSWAWLIIEKKTGSSAYMQDYITLMWQGFLQPIKDQKGKLTESVGTKQDFTGFRIQHVFPLINRLLPGLGHRLFLESSSASRAVRTWGFQGSCTMHFATEIQIRRFSIFGCGFMIFWPGMSSTPSPDWLFPPGHPCFDVAVMRGRLLGP